MRKITGPRVLAGEDIASDVARRVTSRVITRSEQQDAPSLDEVISETIYSEQLRLAHADADPRSHADAHFVADLRRDLAHADETRRHELLYAIVDHYVSEISGHFDRRVYAIATRIVPKALSALLHRLTLSDPSFFDVDDCVLIEGEVETLQSLSRKGTILLAPTHVSNLDSLVLGSAIYRMGLPPFAYGAGLNLFSNALIGFFMRHLGVYTVDRKKRDPLYREVLKEYATLLIENGQHSLFFPGGTRSRSGAVETQLKKGLLGTLPIALRNARTSRAPDARVFVFPCTLTYPLVLEASTLVADYVKGEGGAHYLDVADEFDHPKKWTEFLRGLAELDARVHVRIGRPLDIVGNQVDREGCSLDPRGRPVDPARYLCVDGKLAEDNARDAEYTRLLASALSSAYRADTVALPTSVVAFAVFARLRRQTATLNLFRWLRCLAAEASLVRADVLADVQAILGELARLEARGAIHCGRELFGVDAATVLASALSTFSTYHAVPVIEQRGNRLVVRDVGLLLYYHSRLDGYGLLDGSSVS